jgi:hypothetical protein
MIVFLLATVLLIVGLVLSVTILLLPLGIPLLLVAVRLYIRGLRLLLPTSKDARRAVRKTAWRLAPTINSKRRRARQKRQRKAFSDVKKRLLGS